MSKTIQEFDARLTRLERELARVKASLAWKNEEQWYRQIVGDFEGDKVHREIIRFGRLIRSGRMP